MPRHRSGTIIEKEIKVKGKGGKLKTKTLLYARVSYTKENGKRDYLWQPVENRTQAKEAINKMLKELDGRGSSVFDAARMTFDDLANYFKENYLVEPRYVDGRKVAGMRSYKSQLYFLVDLQNYFAGYKLKAI